MSNQTKVTDFFVHQKKTDKTLRSAKKINSDVFDATDKSLATESSATEQTIPTIKTPKRKKATTSDKSLRSSKRKKTPKSDVIIEFKPNVSEVKEEEKTASNDSVRAEKSDKQLSAKEVKEKLIKCNNLLKLKQGLLTINDCSTKLKQFKEIKVPTPTKKPIRTPTKNRSPAKFSPIRPILSTTPITPIPPLKSPVRMTPNKNSDCVQTYRRCLIKVFEEESPKKSDKKESLRAFERFSYLVRKPEENKTLVLPLKYQVLANMFKAMDTIVSMYYKRQEVCTFDKVKDSVQLMTNKKFDMKRLAQIQSIFSEAFKLKYELFSGFGFNNRKPAYQLIISPVYNSNVDIRHNSSHLLERYQMFVDKLLDIAKRHHKNYLNNLGITINDDELFRWHPKFCLDSVPDIEPNDNALPTEPKFGEHSAETFLENSRQRLGIHSTAEQKTADTNDNQIADNKKTTESNKKITKGLLKGISVDLLKKVMIFTCFRYNLN